MFLAEIPEIDTTEETSVFLDKLFEFFHDNLLNIAVAVGVLIVGWVVIKYISRFVNRRLMKSRVNPLMHGFIKSLIKIVLYFILFITVASILHLPISTFITVLGAAGLAISLSLQNSLSNVAANIILINTKMFDIGDYIEYSGAAGTVQEIGPFNTLLVTPDNKHIHVPNSELVNKPLTNYSAESTRRLDITIGVGYGEDVDRVMDVLTKLVKKNPLVLRDPAPMVRVSSFGDSAVNYLVRVWMATPDYWTLNFELNAEIKRTLDREGINIPYPQLDVHMISAPTE